LVLTCLKFNQRNGADKILVDTSPEEFRGAPLAVQLVGMHQEDDQLMAIAKVVDEALSVPRDPAKL
jgi:Asp-tRNA(Asn)/Glu-tRNA(Gln) amidotransferase A subunit family amidase